ncbi:MAG TPA: SprT family zinc-dependent metalloprotease [Prolixibacteraceae bacterium]|nr:SprT family zinc-dependent metalloprotease [Prolixibacteraceae bacterium]HRV88609.1 SprT family zinc-dependent metalloprotease [Prolixibacteraceae bacterium]
MSVKVVHIHPMGEVIFRRHAASRTIKLSVKPGRKILVSYPVDVPFREAERFVGQHTEWILGQLERQRQVSPYPENTPFKTRYHTVLIVRGGLKTTVRQKGFEWVITLPEAGEHTGYEGMEKVTAIMTEIYRWEARKYLPGRVMELAAQTGLSCGKVTIRNNKSNWGSCSHRNHISLNLHLMKLPGHLIDYVILHELAHTRVKNHGPEFHHLLDELTGHQAARLKAEIRKYSPHHLLPQLNQAT